MKVRHGFVSNSSSSSFIVIGKSEKYEVITPTEGKRDPLTLDLSNLDYFEFGWGPEKITGIESRIAFAMLQCEALSKEPYPRSKWYLRGSETNEAKLLIKLIKIESNLKLLWDLHSDSYIDHASCASEGENTEIFKDYDTLKQFIYAPDSAIYLNNDNDGSEIYDKIHAKLQKTKQKSNR